MQDEGDNVQFRMIIPSNKKTVSWKRKKKEMSHYLEVKSPLATLEYPEPREQDYPYFLQNPSFRQPEGPTHENLLIIKKKLLRRPPA
jgi:hypothetical protein